MSAFQRITSYATVFVLFCTTLITPSDLYGQAPEGVNYQAVARDNGGAPLSNQIISVRFSVIANSTSGAVLYQEDHSAISTNAFGLFNLIIGGGNRTGGSLATFSAIDWSSGSKFLRVQVDAGSGFENLGTTQMLSVPYALYAKTAGNSSNSLVGGNGIIVRNDSIINDGDQSESNELISSFSLLAGNILRITEASTDYDVDLTSILPTSTDDQNLSFSSNGDSILIDDGDGIAIQFILDDIVNNANDIITNQTDITALNTDLSTLENNFSLDSTQTLENQDSIAILTNLLGNVNDNQNLEIRNDSIVIDRGTGVDIEFLATDAKLSADSALLVSRISTNETDIANNTQAIVDSSLNTRDLLADSTTALRNLFATGSDDQNLSFNQAGDSILIENGDGLNIQFITDTIANYDARIIANKTATETNETDIITNQNEIGFLKTDVANLQTSFSTDSSLTLQNQDSIGILTTLLGSDNDADSTNELISGITLVDDTLKIFENGILSSELSLDTLFNFRRLNLFNRTIDNRDSIRILATLIGNDNDTSASNEIQQLSLVGDQLSIDDPSGTITQTPIDLSIYNTADNLGNHQLDSNLRLGAFYVSGDGDNEGLLIDGSGNSTFSSGLRLNSDQVATGYPLSIRAASTRVLEITDAVTNAVEWDLNFVGGNLEFNETGVGAPLTLAAGNQVGIATTTPDSTLTVNGGIKSTYFTLTDGAVDGSVLTSDANGVATWQAADGGVFEKVAGVIRDTTADYSSDFVLGSPQLDDDGITAHDNRMFFDKSLGAFRAGGVNGIDWDEDSLGLFSVAFGQNTRASGDRSTVGGGSVNRAIGDGSTIAGGSQNSAGRQTFVGGGVNNNASQAFSAFIGGGQNHLVTGANAVIVGGANNTASAFHSSIGGGQVNTASGSYATIGGGQRNLASGSNATIGGGQLDTASGTNSTIGGGQLNAATALNATVAGGNSNNSTGSASSIGGGQLNTASNTFSTIGGGNQNIASGEVSTIGGGQRDTASGFGATVGGGENNNASNTYSTIGGGERNTASGLNSIIAGGTTNTASGAQAIIGGGSLNEAIGAYSVIGGGNGNITTSGVSTIGGGQLNIASGSHSTISGGEANFAGGANSAILGGIGNVAQSFNEIAMGTYNDTVTGLLFPLTYNTADRLLVIGNGTADNARSNALVMLKNGNTTLNGALTLSDGSNPFTLPNSDGTAGQILQTNGSGIVTWEDGSGNGIYGGTGLLSGNTEVTQGANSLSFTSTATDAFTIDTTTFAVNAATNKVGIGTATLNSSSSLEISGSGIYGAGLELRNGGSRVALTNNGNSFQLIKVDGATTTHMTIENNTGEVGIGTAFPAYLLDVNGTFSANSINVNDEYSFPDTAGTIGQILQTDASGNPIWSAAPQSGGVFEKVAGVIRDTTSDYSSDFVLGSPQLADDTDPTHDNRMFFDKSKGAFRAGTAELTEWDDASVGIASVAFGFNNTASGDGAFIGSGDGNTASGLVSFIGGGFTNTSSADYTTIAGGRLNNVSADWGTIGGGNGNRVTSDGATIAGGQLGVASGVASFIGGGSSNRARGDYSQVSGGFSNVAQSFSEVVLGTYNDTLTSALSTNSFSATDRLLVIGNGTFGSRSNALVMLKNGNTTLNGALTLSDGSNPFTLPNSDGAAGQILQTDGSGAVTWTSLNAATTCPVGMTSVNGNICIETNERAASDWYDAAQTCTSLGYKLPTWAEWYGAATNAVLTNEINNWEWVSDGTSNTARKVGNTDLKNTANDDPETGSEAFRCIYYR